jgi:hypothetical protein
VPSRVPKTHRNNTASPAAPSSEVTAEDINRRLVFNLEIVDGIANGVIEVPAGEGRTFEVSAFDDHHNVTHTGSETTDVNPGSNPPQRFRQGRISSWLRMLILISMAASQLTSGSVPHCLLPTSAT